MTDRYWANSSALSGLGFGERDRKTSSVVGLDVKTSPNFQSRRGTRRLSQLKFRLEKM